MPNTKELLGKLIDKLASWLEALIVMLPNLLLAGAIVTVAVFASRLLRRLVHSIVYRASANAPISDLLGTASRVGAIALGCFFALGLLNLDRTVTSLLAGVGVVGFALGFAFQDIAANFMSGFLMALRRPFDLGDLVQVAGHRGRVKKLSLRASELETLDGLSILVPNKDIFQNPIINYTLTASRRLDFSMGTSYGDDMVTVRRVVLEAVQDVPHRDREREVELFFEDFDDSSINFQVRIWLDQSDEQSYWHARSEAMIAIKRALDREKLTIPYPIHTLDFGGEEGMLQRRDGFQVTLTRGAPNSLARGLDDEKRKGATGRQEGNEPRAQSESAVEAGSTAREP